MNILNPCVKFVKKYIKSLLLGFTFISLCGLLIYQWTNRNVDCIGNYDLDFLKYLIHNDKCTMPELTPWHNDALLAFEHLTYTPNNAPHLVDMDRREDKIFLVLKRTSMPISKCIACDVIRDANNIVPDNNILYTNCTKFKDEIEMRSSITEVKCFKKEKRKTPIYKDVFANYIWTNKRHKATVRDHKPYNVLIIGIDSVSKLNFIRTLKKTYKFLLASNWVHFLAYNKVGENTMPNVMALLSGMSYQNPYNSTFFDKEKFIWQDYSSLGYTTAFAEDHKSWSTFNNGFTGFKHKPTDFYFRPYTVAMENLETQLMDKTITETVFTAGGKIVGYRIFQLVTELPKACKDEPYFGFFWMNTFSHDDLNTPQLMDKHIVNFMDDLQKNNVFNDTILIFLSDHGMRMGTIRRTIMGSYEDRMPFLFVRVPDHFKYTHPKQHKNFIRNRKKLTSTFDLHMTLQHILILSKLNYTLKAAKTCPTCLSIFEELPAIRSCAEAGIANQFCACMRLIDVTTEQFTIKIAQHVVQTIQKLIDSYRNESGKCQKLKLSRVLYARMGEQPVREIGTHFNLVLETVPNTTIEAILEVVLENRNIISQTMIGGPYRIDRYENTGRCCTNFYLRKFCYCRREDRK